jgi:phosphoglycerate dehydrogenase-like enzyme
MKFKVFVVNASRVGWIDEEAFILFCIRAFGRAAFTTFEDE